MPKKAPRFQLANRVVILTFFLSALIVGFYQLTTRGIGVAWMGFIAVLYLLIPPLYRRIFHLKPVSYTHLDVYKRQVQMSVR